MKTPCQILVSVQNGTEFSAAAGLTADVDDVVWDAPTIELRGFVMFRDAAADEFFRAAFFDGKERRLQLALVDRGVVRGQFRLTKLDFDREERGTVVYSCALSGADLTYFPTRHKNAAGQETAARLGAAFFVYQDGMKRTQPRALDDIERRIYSAMSGRRAVPPNLFFGTEDALALFIGQQLEEAMAGGQTPPDVRSIGRQIARAILIRGETAAGAVSSEAGNPNGRPPEGEGGPGAPGLGQPRAG